MISRNLGKRIEGTMNHKVGWHVSVWKKPLLSLLGLAAVVSPISFGTTTAPVVAQGQPKPVEFEVASVKRNRNGGPGGRLRYNPMGVDFSDVPLSWVIGEAYQVPYA